MNKIEITLLDKKTKEPLPFERVKLTSSKLVHNTNEKGQTTILLADTIITDTLKVRPIQYVPTSFNLDFRKGSLLKITMEMEFGFRSKENKIDTLYIKHVSQRHLDMKPKEDKFVYNFYRHHRYMRVKRRQFKHEN